MISKDLYKAARLLYTDAVVAVPTETVYGLAANIYSETAIQEIFKIKGRPESNPLIVHVGSKDAVEEIASEIPSKAKQLMDKFWPGPLTLVLPKHDSVPYSVTGGQNTVAIRMPNHPDTLKLLRLLSFPLAAPSANPYGSISPTCAAHVAGYFAEKIPMILDGGICKNGLESTIIGFENNTPVIYRLGSIPVEEIEREIGPVAVRNFQDHQTLVPGMMRKHYAPRTPTISVTDVNDAILFYQGKKIGLLLYEHTTRHQHVVHQEILSTSKDLQEAGSRLYAALHTLDTLGLDIIIAERFPESDLGRVINDRLMRAGG